MTLERQLSDAMKSLDAVDPSPDALSRLHARLNPQPRNGRAGFAIVGALAAVVAGVLALGVLIGWVAFRDSSPATGLAAGGPLLVECRAAHQPLIADADALPPKGNTDLANVTRVLDTSQDLIKRKVSGVNVLRVQPRDGQVWSRDTAGAVVVEPVNDFWIVAELASNADCPTAPMYFNGVPIRFLAPPA